MAHGSFAVGEILTATNLNAHTIPNDAIAIASIAGSQSITASTTTTVNAAEVLDPLGWYLNGIFTPDIAGWYRFSIEIHWSADTDYTRLLHILSKNDATTTAHFDHSGGFTTTGPDYTSHAYFQLNGSTDTLRLKVQQQNTSGGTETLDAGTSMVVELVYPT